jgi:hypothetical protein
VKTNRRFAWTIGAGLLLGTILGIPTASSQNASGDLSGARQWMAVMDTDHDGTASRKEFMTYMGGQFDKANPDHDGTLDLRELEQLRKNLIAAGQ